MNRSIVRSLSVVFASAIISVWPLAASAQPSVPEAPDLTPEQVQASFVRGGYEVDPLLHWDWIAPPMTSFRVRDPQFDRRTSAQMPRTDRALMVELGHGARRPVAGPNP